MIDFDEIAMKLAKAEADNEVLRKALDLAIGALDNIKKNCTTMIETESVCRYALEQITALEQKDHFADVSKMIEQKDVK